MKSCFFILISILLALPTRSFAQTDSSKAQPAQVCFLYPLGSSGTSSIDQRYVFSLNIIDGINAGFDGFECASIFNINTDDVNGAQLAGIFNHTDGNHYGAKFAGIANYNTGSITGGEFAGLINLSQSTTGAQFAPINISTQFIDGAQFGCINITKEIGSEKGMGAQAGLVNIANNVKGTQVGLINISGNIDGCKVGLVNIADSINGVAIGLINIAKNGYYAIEASTNELLISSIALKMGTPYFYSIIKTGYTTYKSRDVLAIGFGAGTMTQFSPKHQFQLELVSSNLVYDWNWNLDKDRYNILTTLSLNYRFNFNKNLAISVGPTVNSYTSNTRVDGKFGVVDIPYTLYTHTHVDKYDHDDDFEGIGVHKHSFWIGANVGISINL